MSKRIGHIWFTNNSTIGIVLCHDEITKELKSWIGSVSGTDSESDLKFVQEHGAKFPIQSAIILIKKYGKLDVTINEFTTLVMNVYIMSDSYQKELKETQDNYIKSMSENKIENSST